MKARDKGGVVDTRLNIYGVQNLKIADMSICPSNVATVSLRSVFVPFLRDDLRTWILEHLFYCCHGGRKGGCDHRRGPGNSERLGIKSAHGLKVAHAVFSRSRVRNGRQYYVVCKFDEQKFWVDGNGRCSFWIRTYPKDQSHSYAQQRRGSSGTMHSIRPFNRHSSEYPALPRSICSHHKLDAPSFNRESAASSGRGGNPRLRRRTGCLP